MLLGEEMMDIKDMRRQGLTIKEIAERTGRDRKTVRKYLKRSGPPRYTARPPAGSKLNPFKSYVRARMSEGMTNGVKMFKEIKERGYPGGMTVLKDFMRPLRPAREAATMRFETEPGLQTQVDWGHCGRIFHEGRVRPLYCFVMTLGFSRMSYVEFTTRCDTLTFMRSHVSAFAYFSGVTSEILYDNTKSVVTKRMLEKIVLNGRFKDMADYYGFTPRLCKPYRPETKGKVESGVKYVKGNFLLGEVFSSLDEINAAVRVWLDTVANQRIHGTTGDTPISRFEVEAARLKSIAGCVPFDTSEHTMRRVTLDCLVSYKGSRYSVPSKTARALVIVKEDSGGVIHIFFDGERVARHRRAAKGETVINPEHYRGIKRSDDRPTRPLVVHGLSAPVVQMRDLSVYEEAM